MASRKQIPFKSPLCQGQRQSQSRGVPPGRQDVMSDLRQRLAHLQTEIRELETQGYQESELAIHIDKMHEYNEIKDVGQVVLGQIANLEGVRTKDLYEKYGLKLDD